MKRNMTALTAITMAAAMMLSACGGSGAGNAAKTAAESGASETEASGTESGSGETELSGKTVTVGIGQYADHGSLDNCREGFLQGLAENGFVEGENLTVDYQNANGDGSTTNLINQAFVGEKADLICAIATPMAQAAYTAARNTDIPVIYTAVTDPEAAELADADGKPVGNISGTSDKLPVEEQLKMIREILPEAKTLAIMYTTSEANSASSVAEYEALASEYGFTLHAVGVSQPSEIALAADSMLSDCDAVTMITDNNVVASLPLILSKASAKKIPVFGSEIEQVKIGCLAAMGLDYVSLGRQTGAMAAKVLKGEAKASEMNYELIEGAAFYGNTKVAEDLRLTLPEDLVSGAAEMFDSIAE